MSKVFDLWNEVGGAFGPSGREDAVRETIAAIAGEYIDDITTDALGNLICRKKGAGKKLLFAAHMDSIGVVATWIDEQGFIRFSQVGGLFKGDLINIQVRFANGTRGVISYEEKTPFKDITWTTSSLILVRRIGRMQRDRCRSATSRCSTRRALNRTACCAVRTWIIASAA